MGAVRTWHAELAFVVLVLAAVAALSGGGSVEWVGVGAVSLSFAHAQVADRLAEREASRAVAGVDCYRWAAARPDFKGSLTVELIRFFRAMCPQYAFRFVVGSDLVDQCPTWEGWDEIVAQAPPIVVNRAGYATATAPHQLTLPDVSSSAVRAAFAAGEDVSQLVPSAVLEYIQAHGLYPSAKLTPYERRRLNERGYL